MRPYEKRLQKLARTLLKEANVQESPTPTKKLLDLLDLQVKGFGEEEKTGTIDNKERLLTKALLEERSTFQQIHHPKHPAVKAILDINKRLIGVHKNLHPAAKTFSIEHEIGHFCIPEHRQTIYQCNYFDLSSATTKQMEREANEFASHLRFQVDRFTQIAADYSLSLNSAIKLAGDFEASLESTFRRYVETHRKACCLIILLQKDTTLAEDEEVPFLKTNYGVLSSRFRAFRRINANIDIPYDDILSKICRNVIYEYNEPKESETSLTIGETKMERTDTRGNLPRGCEIPLAIDENNYLFKGEVFFNSYKIFILLKSYKRVGSLVSVV